MNFFPIFLAIIGGFAIALQAQIMGSISKEMGWMTNVLVIYMVGLIVIVLLISVSFVTHRMVGKPFIPPSLSGFSSWYQLTAGFYGVVIVGIIGIVSYRLGVVPTLVIVFVSQIFLGKVITHFGWLGTVQRSLTLSESLSLLLLMAGTTALLISEAHAA